MALERVKACLCGPCQYCQRKGYSLYSHEKSEVISVQPISSTKIDEAKPQNSVVQGSGRQSSTVQASGNQDATVQGSRNHSSAEFEGSGRKDQEGSVDVPPPPPTSPPPGSEDVPPPLPSSPPPEVDPIAEEAPGSSESEVVRVREVDLCFTVNGSEHHTWHYDLMTRHVNQQLVVRRGQPFQLDAVLSRAYNPVTDGISFIFTLAEAERPSYGHGTLVAVPLLTKAPTANDTWTAVLQRSSENVISVHITPPHNCVVGIWKMDIDTKLMNDGALSFSHKAKIYILFNPWCKKDQVYLKEEDRRQEYIKMDTGLIWRGSYNSMRPCVWNYAQFDKDILDCSLYLVTRTGKLSLASCSDPVKVARVLSAAVNSPDDNGALMGNWTAEFGGGTPPTKWVGSLKILQKYWATKKPVKYGQCWVFAGVLTTVCRALGIPARTITTYASAHDTQNSLTVDYFVDEKGEIMEELTSDSIWNFHVWNEVWMRRPDLAPSGDYDGWNVIDATPQETSDDMFRCGPTSVKAVKKGEVLKPYDSAFVYAEVNADKVFWRYSGPTQPLKLLRKDMTGIGRAITTKAVGKWSVEDITSSYKYPEKSREERTTMLQALKQSESVFSRYYLNEEFNDVRFDFKLIDDIVIGSSFSTSVVISNRSRDKDYTVSVILRVDTVLYTGKVQDTVKKDKFDIVVKRKSEEDVKLNVSYNEYYGKLVDQCAFNIACLGTVHDTNYEYFAQDDFRVRKPDIKFHALNESGVAVVLGGESLTLSDRVKTLGVVLGRNLTFSDHVTHAIQRALGRLRGLYRFRTLLPEPAKLQLMHLLIDGTPYEGQEFTAKASFINPLPVTLKKGKFLLEGPSLETPLKIKLDYNVEPKGEAKATFKATPKFAGKQTIAAKFYSNELEDVDGFIVFMVGEKPPGDTNGLSNNIPNLA